MILALRCGVYDGAETIIVAQKALPWWVAFFVQVYSTRNTGKGVVYSNINS